MKKNFLAICLTAFLFLIDKTEEACATELFVISGQTSEEALRIKPIIRAAYKAIGIYPIFKYYRGTRSLNLVNRGENDADIARVMGINVMYPNLVRVDVPVGAIEVVMVVRKDSRITSVTLKELVNIRLAYPRGIEYLKKRIHGKHSRGVTEEGEILSMLEGRRIEIGFMLLMTAKKLLKKRKDLEIIPSPFEPIEVYHYIHKKHIHLKPKLELTLRKMLPV